MIFTLVILKIVAGIVGELNIHSFQSWSLALIKWRMSSDYSDFYLFSIYRHPDADDGIYDCLLTSMAIIQESNRKASFHHKYPLTEGLNSVSSADGRGHRGYNISLRVWV